MANKRAAILVMIFAVLVGALAYDFIVARPGVDAGYNTVIKLLETRTLAKHGEGKIGPADVQQALGRKPATTSQTGLSTVETYQWRAGMPLRTYKLYVLYHGLKEPLLANALKNEPPSKQELSSVEIPTQAQPMTSAPVLHSPGDSLGDQTPPVQE